MVYCFSKQKGADIMADSWEVLKQECMQCRGCGLAATRTNLVFGDGAQNAEILLIGEGPGQIGRASCRERV